MNTKLIVYILATPILGFNFQDLAKTLAPNTYSHFKRKKKGWLFKGLFWVIGYLLWWATYFK